jgi:hypothetical protein
LYSSTKKPVQWMMQILMSMMSSLGMGCLARLANVAPWNRSLTRSSNPCDECHFKAMSVQLALQLLADVQPYIVTNQANISQKTELGFSIWICSYDCLKATKMRLRKALMRTGFMLMMLLRCLSDMEWVTLALAGMLVSVHPL